MIIRKLGPIRRIPADTAFRNHGTEQHATVDANLLTSVLRHIGFEVIPTILGIFAVRILIRKVDKGIRVGCAVFRRCNLRAKPRDGSALWNINPGTECRRGSRDINIAAQAEASTICTSDARPIKVKLYRLMAKANDICIICVGIGNDGTSDHTSAAWITICGYSAGVHPIKTMDRITYRAVIMTVIVTTIKHNRWLFANIYGRSG